MIINAPGTSPYHPYPYPDAGHPDAAQGLPASGLQTRRPALMDRIMQHLDHAANAWVHASDFAHSLPEPLQKDVKAFGAAFKSAAIVSTQVLVDGTINAKLRNYGYRGKPVSVRGVFKQANNLFQLTQLLVQHGQSEYRLTPPPSFTHQPPGPAAPDLGSTGRVPSPALKTSLRPAPGLPFATDNRTVQQAYARVKPRLQRLADALSEQTQNADASRSLSTRDYMAAPEQYKKAFGADFRIIGNSGETSTQKNNCFFIAAQQLSAMACGRTAHGTPDAASIEHFRNHPEQGEEAPNEMIFSNGPLARRFVDALNAGKPPNQQIRVNVVQVVAGHVLEEAYGSHHSDAKQSYMVDMGGHFEALAAKPSAQA